MSVGSTEAFNQRIVVCIVFDSLGHCVSDCYLCLQISSLEDLDAYVDA